ncbi:hypothetical protein [Sulfitobacter sp. PS-8MA]|uniref:hypothetical protein n=1 Tax=Sulfitobacter sp. PS-8MA TaxID=3237707 RepID=UPI0034C5CE0F
MEIRALYAQADALVASLPEGLQQEEAAEEAQQDDPEDRETRPFASSVQPQCVDSDPEQGNPR